MIKRFQSFIHNEKLTRITSSSTGICMKCEAEWGGLDAHSEVIHHLRATGHEVVFVASQLERWEAE